MRVFRSFACSCLVSLIALLLSATARAEELRILAYEGYVTQAMANEFTAAMEAKGLDVTVKIDHISDPQEIFDALRYKSVDIVTPTHNVYKSEKWRLIANKLLLPIDVARLPNYRHLVPMMKQLEYLSEDDKTYGVPYTFGSYGLAYNAALLDKAPTSWNALFDPKFSGQYAVSSDYHEANIYVAALASGVPRDKIGNVEDLFAFPEVQAKLNYLATNAKVLWKGVDTAQDLKGLTMAASWGFALPALNRQGESWKMAKPREGVTGWIDSFSIAAEVAKTPQRQVLAEEVLNYVISQKVQVNNVVRGLGSFPVSGDVRALLSKREIKDFRIDEPEFFVKEFILWKTLSLRNQNGLKLMWERAKQTRAAIARQSSEAPEAPELTIVFAEGLEPLCWEENGRPQGLQPEIAQHVLSRLNIKARFRFLPWARAQQEVEDGRADLMMTTPNKARFEYAVFGREMTTPNYWNLFIKSDRKDLIDNARSFTSLSDLKPYTVLDFNGNGWTTHFMKESDGYKIDTANTMEQVVKKLSLGRGDVIINSSASVNWFTRKLGLKDDITEVDFVAPGTRFHMVFQLSRKSPWVQKGLIKALDIELKKMKDSGAWLDALKKYKDPHGAGRPFTSMLDTAHFYTAYDSYPLYEPRH